MQDIKLLLILSVAALWLKFQRQIDFTDIGDGINRIPESWVSGILMRTLLFLLVPTDYTTISMNPTKEKCRGEMQWIARCSASQ